MKSRTLFFLCCMVTALCAQTPADVVIYDAKILTMDDQKSEAEALAITAGHVAAVGSNKEIKKYIGPQTQVLRLAGKRVLPGFIDNHVHFMAGGFQLLGIDLRSAKNPAEFIQRISDQAKRFPGKWITGGDWDHENWPDTPLPTKEWIDAVTPNTPVFVSRFDGHMGVANSMALAMAGITAKTPDPPGGEIVKDPRSGEPTGMLKDEAMSAVYRQVPDATDEDCVQAALAALAEARKYGVTSLQDLSSAQDVRVYQRLRREGRLTSRMHCRLPVYSIDHVIASGIETGMGDDWIRVGGLKAFADGSLGSSTALFYAPYEGQPHMFGLASDVLLDGRMEKWILQADRFSLQVSTHAIGDSANSRTLDCYELAAGKNPKWDRRHRIEHAQHLADKDIPRFAELNVLPSMQPYHLIDDGRWAVKRIGEARCRNAYMIKSLLEHGAKVSFGTDWTVAPINPMWGIYAAVTRRTLDGKNPNGWIPEEKITVQQALRCYTVNSAYTGYEENVKGCLKPGYLADLVVVSDDILKIDPVKIWDVSIEMTMVGGQIVYKK